MKISTPLNQIYRLHLSFKQLLLGDFWGERNYLPEAIRHYFFTQIMQERNQVCGDIRINTMLLHSKNDVIAVQSQ